MATQFAPGDGYSVSANFGRPLFTVMGRMFVANNVSGDSTFWTFDGVADGHYMFMRYIDASTAQVKVISKEDGNFDTVTSTAGVIAPQEWHTFNIEFRDAADKWGGIDAAFGLLLDVAGGHTPDEDMTAMACSTGMPSTLRMTDFAIWSTGLNNDDRNAYNKGFQGWRIRPQSLVYWAPMVRVMMDRRRGVTFSVSGAHTTEAHPRVYGGA